MDLSEAVARGLAEGSAEERAREAGQREEFLTRFPLSGWADLPLDRYALGAGVYKSGYSYWLEWGTSALGSIAGGSAHKHVIFRRRDGDWSYPQGYSSVTEAWEALRASFVRMFALAERGEWSAIEQIDMLRGSRTVRMKSLHLYFPEAVLPVYSEAHLKHFAELVGVETSGDVVDLNRRLFARLRDEPGLEQSSTRDLARLLYAWDRPAGARKSTYWKVSPGEQARFWEECEAGGFICVGWDEIGDLTLFDSEDDFQAAFVETYPTSYRGHRPTQRRKANELWRLTQMAEGDHIIANKGTAEVMGVGVVQAGGYRWDPERSEYKHTLAVDWIPKSGRVLDPPVKQWGTTTILKATAAMVDQVLGKSTSPRRADPETVDVAPSDLADYERWQRILHRKGQLIFYGPPGTGKTRVAKGFARWLLGQDASANALTEITFHASYAYEEFVEGYRPVRANGATHLELKPGVMKRVAAAAAADEPDNPHVLLIDEINRANVPRVFGELMTVLERSRRGETVELPASGDQLAVPANLVVLGTMNTADRSIRTLDAALRRRFGFIEILPDPSVVEGAVAGPLRLDIFLEQLNGRIVSRAGREAQVGHAFFLDNGVPLQAVDELADVIRTDIIPLLQEIAFDDYGQLAAYLGAAIIDVDAQRVREDVLSNDDRLLEALASELDARADSSSA